MAKLNVLQNPEVDADVDLLKSTLSRYGVDVPKRASAKKLAELLRKTYKERIEEKELPESEWIQCGACKEITDDDPALEVCPFCGDDGEEVDATTSALEETEEDIDDETEDPEDDPETESAEDEEPEEDDEETSEDDEEEPETASDDEDDAESEDDEEEPEEDGEPEEEPESKKAEIIDARAFEEVATEIDQKHREMAGDAYELGALLREIYESESWRDAGYKSFKDATKERFGYTPQFCNGLIRAAREFTRDDFAAVGSTKLIVLANVDAEDRAELLEKAKTEGTSRRDLKKEVKKRKEKKEKKEGKAPEKEKKGKPGRPSKEDRTITLIGKVGGKPVNSKFIDAETGKELKEWAPGSFAKVQLSEEVSIFVALRTRKKDGTITGVSTLIQRDDANEEKETPEAAE